jgi:hypothetical protein
LAKSLAVERVATALVEDPFATTFAVAPCAA